MNRQHWKELLPIITAFANGENVEFQNASGDWIGSKEQINFQLLSDRYRIAPRTIRIGNYDVPEPYRGEMEDGQEYYVPAVDNRHFQSSCQWGGDSFDKRYMNLGIIHLTPEAAALHGKALASLTAGEGVEL